MRYFILLMLAIASSAFGGFARADGLIFHLPADGAWARYAVKTEASQRIGEFKQAINTTGTLTISSVGKLMRHQQNYRWIELQSTSEGDGVYPKLVLKMLIPEKRLQRGQDPLAYSALTFFDPKPMDEKKSPLIESFIDEGFNRIQYEIDRFRVDFPKPLYNSKTLDRETLEIPAGRFENCEIITGTSGYDGPLVMNGRSVHKGTYRIAIHPKAPFGVVSMAIETTGREFSEEDEDIVHLTAKRTLTLAEMGEKAVSALPESGKEKPSE